MFGYFALSQNSRSLINDLRKDRELLICKMPTRITPVNSRSKWQVCPCSLRWSGYLTPHCGCHWQEFPCFLHFWVQLDHCQVIKKNSKQWHIWFKKSCRYLPSHTYLEVPLVIYTGISYWFPSHPWRGGTVSRDQGGESQGLGFLERVDSHTGEVSAVQHIAPAGRVQMKGGQVQLAPILVFPKVFLRTTLLFQALRGIVL